jgi:hypothetical protein
MSFIELAAAVGVACGAAIGVFTLLEKITGAGSRWLARGVQAGVQPLSAELEHVKESVDEVKHLQRYHFGPNGNTRRIHERVEAIERAVMNVRSEQAKVRGDLERQPPHVDWNGPYSQDDAVD